MRNIKNIIPVHIKLQEQDLENNMHYVFSGQKMYKLIHLFMCSGVNNQELKIQAKLYYVDLIVMNVLYALISMQTIHYPFVFGFE